MAPLTDQTLLTAYTNALANRRFEGYVVWTEVAQRWVRRELAGLTTAEVAERIWDYVDAGGEIDQVVERREEWSHHDYHYDLRLTIGRRKVYIETRLSFDDPLDPDDPLILVANIHDV